MHHYGLSQLVDFTRDLTSAGETAAICQHLEACEACNDLASFFGNVVQVTRRAAECEPPQWLLRAAKSVFAPAAQLYPKHVVSIPVELIYDASMPLPAEGFRANSPEAWQALYRGGDYWIDLRVEPEAGSVRAALMGQICSSAAENILLKNLQVIVKSGRTVLAETRTNESAEFQLEYDQQSRQQLSIYLHGGLRRLELPLKTLALDHHQRLEQLGLAIPKEQRD